MDQFLEELTRGTIERSERTAKAIREVYGDDPFSTEAAVELDAVETLLQRMSGE